jgi:hypothetical protein
MRYGQMNINWKKVKYVVHHPIPHYVGFASIYGSIYFCIEYLKWNSWSYLALLVLVPAWGGTSIICKWSEEITIESDD